MRFSHVTAACAAACLTLLATSVSADPVFRLSLSSPAPISSGSGGIEEPTPETDPLNSEARGRVNIETFGPMEMWWITRAEYTAGYYPITVRTANPSDSTHIRIRVDDFSSGAVVHVNGTPAYLENGDYYGDVFPFENYIELIVSITSEDGSTVSEFNFHVTRE